MTGSVISQLIAISSLPIITKLYTPEDLGFYAICLSIVSIMGMVSSLRLERSLFSLHGSDGFNQRLSGAISVSLLISILLALIVFLLSIGGVIEISEYVSIYLLFWGWGTSLIQILVVSSSATGDFSTVSRTSIMRSFSLFLLQVSLFFIFESRVALIISGIISVFLCSIMLMKKHFVLFKPVNAVKYIFDNWNDCINGFLQSFFSSVSNNISILIISQLWGLKSAGIFLLADKLVRIPINLISNNLRPVVANYYQKKENRNILSITKVSVASALLSMLITIFVIASIDRVVELFLDENWKDASSYIKIMVLIVIPNFISLPFQSYNVHYLKMKYTTIVEALSLILKLFLFFLFFYQGYGLMGACIAIVVTYIFTGMLNIGISIFNLKTKSRHLNEY